MVRLYCHEVLPYKVYDPVQPTFLKKKKKIAADTLYIGAILFGHRVAVSFTGVFAFRCFIFIVHVYRRLFVVLFSFLYIVLYRIMLLGHVTAGLFILRALIKMHLHGAPP